MLKITTKVHTAFQFNGHLELVTEVERGGQLLTHRYLVPVEHFIDQSILDAVLERNSHIVKHVMPDLIKEGKL